MRTGPRVARTPASCRLISCRNTASSRIWACSPSPLRRSWAWADLSRTSRRTFRASGSGRLTGRRPRVRMNSTRSTAYTSRVRSAGIVWRSYRQRAARGHTPPPAAATSGASACRHSARVGLSQSNTSPSRATSSPTDRRAATVDRPPAFSLAFRAARGVEEGRPDEVPGPLGLPGAGEQPLRVRHHRGERGRVVRVGVVFPPVGDGRRRGSGTRAPRAVGSRPRPPPRPRLREEPSARPAGSAGWGRLPRPRGGANWNRSR